MIPSILGILVILVGLFMVHLGVYGHDKLMPIYPLVEKPITEAS